MSSATHPDTYERIDCLSMGSSGRLSGGEKARIALALIPYDPPNFVVLDEPTNYLDMDTKAMLVRAYSLEAATESGLAFKACIVPCRALTLPGAGFDSRRLHQFPWQFRC
jgi:ABC-type phosphonate transport system ATPase subunit